MCEMDDNAITRGILDDRWKDGSDLCGFDQEYCTGTLDLMRFVSKEGIDITLTLLLLLQKGLVNVLLTTQ